MLLTIIQSIIATLVTILASAEIIAWAIMGRISGIGYIIAFAIIAFLANLTRITYRELINEYRR
jgi:hypothetical protein